MVYVVRMNVAAIHVCCGEAKKVLFSCIGINLIKDPYRTQMRKRSAFATAIVFVIAIMKIMVPSTAVAAQQQQINSNTFFS